MKLSAWVRDARTHRGWTQEKLAERLKVTKSNVSAWENGRHEPSFAQVRSISNETGYPIPNDGEPKLPGSDFRDRREVSESDWTLLQAVKVATTDQERDAIVRRADELMRQVEERIAAAKEPR